MKSKKHILELISISNLIRDISMTYEPRGDEYKQDKIKSLMDRAAEVNLLLRKNK